MRAVRDEVTRDEAVREAAAPPEEDVLIGKGADETTFLIADRSEQWLLGRLSLQAGAALAGWAGAVMVFGVSLLARSGLLPGGWIVRNTRIEQIPYILFARLLNFAPREMYKVAAAERAVPGIKFAFPR